MFARPRLSMSPALNTVESGGLESILRLRDLAGNRLPHHLWHLVIHEFTHHWEFLGPVGTALNVLYVRQCEKVSRAIDEQNAVVIRGRAVGEVVLSGRGAGSMPTAAAILSDVVWSTAA